MRGSVEGRRVHAVVRQRPSLDADDYPAAPPGRYVGRASLDRDLIARLTPAVVDIIFTVTLKAAHPAHCGGVKPVSGLP